MSQVLPYEENLSRYDNDGGDEQMSLSCRARNTNNFFSSTQTSKRPPKLGQIGRSKRVVIEDDRLDEVLQDPAEKLPAK